MASGKSLEKGEPHMATLHYRKDGQPIQMVDKNNNPVKRVRMSKKERLRLRQEKMGTIKASESRIDDNKT